MLGKDPLIQSTAKKVIDKARIIRYLALSLGMMMALLVIYEIIKDMILK